MTPRETLRQQVEQALAEAFTGKTLDTGRAQVLTTVSRAIGPLLAHAEATIRTLIREIEKLQYEQAISEGRLRVLLEKADALRTAEIRCDNLEAERDAARAELDELQNEFVGQNRRLGTAEAALASARAETSALYGLLEQALNGWGAHARKNIEHSDIRRLRALAHRGERP